MSELDPRSAVTTERGPESGFHTTHSQLTATQPTSPWSCTALASGGSVAGRLTEDPTVLDPIRAAMRRTVGLPTPTLRRRGR